MAATVERLELGLDPALAQRIDEWRSDEDGAPSRAEAVHRLIERALEGSSTDLRPSRSKMLLLWMVAELLKQRTSQEDKEAAELVQQAIYSGHYRVLEWELTRILHDHVDRRGAVALVVDALDMWTLVERAYAGFSDAEKERIAAEVGPSGRDPRFLGFDGNQEVEYLGIARVMIEHMGWFEALKGRPINSHVPMIESYRRMTATFEPIRVRLTGRELSPDEVIKLLRRA